MENIKMIIKLENILDKVKKYIKKQEEKRAEEKSIWNIFKGKYLNTLNDNIYREGMKKANEKYSKLSKIEDLISLIKFDIDVCRFLEGEKSLSNEEFEILLKKFEIEVNPRTLGWIRKSLNMIGVGSYSYVGNKSSVILDLADKLADAIKEKYKFIDDDIINKAIEEHEKSREEYIEFITLDKKDNKINIDNLDKKESITNNDKAEIFYIKNTDGEYKKVEGYRLKNKYNLDLFYREVALGNYGVTHTPTGIAIEGIIATNKEELIKKLDKFIEKNGLDVVLSVFDYVIKEQGLVPNYKQNKNNNSDKNDFKDTTSINRKDKNIINTANKTIVKNNCKNILEKYARSLDLKYYQKLKKVVLSSSINIFKYGQDNNLNDNDIGIMLYMTYKLNNNGYIPDNPNDFTIEENYK